MSLSQAKLTNELLKLLDPNNSHFVGYPTDANTFATNWANAYDTYARDAVDVSTDVLLTSNKNGFRDALAVLNIPNGVIVTAAGAFDSALIAYWTGAVFAVGTPPSPGAACASAGGNGTWATEVSSIVATVTVGVLEASMASLLAIPSSDPSVKATALAAAFHNATTSAVKVLITGTDTTVPPTGPLAITNTCTIS